MSKVNQAVSFLIINKSKANKVFKGHKEKANYKIIRNQKNQSKIRKIPY